MKSQLKVLLATVASALLVASCATEGPRPQPSPPVVTPVKLELAPSNEAVKQASRATAAANAVVEMQAKELRDTKQEVSDAKDLAEEAYEKGLIAGSEQALLMRDLVTKLQERVQALTLMNEAVFADLKEAAQQLNTALTELAALQEEVGKAKQAVNVQTQLADNNRAAFEAQAQANAALTDSLAVQTDRKERWRAVAIVASGLILLAVLLFLSKAYFRPLL